MGLLLAICSKRVIKLEANSKLWLNKETFERRIAEMTPEQLRITLKALWQGYYWFDAIETAMASAEPEVNHFWEKEKAPAATEA